MAERLLLPCFTNPVASGWICQRDFGRIVKADQKYSRFKLFFADSTPRGLALFFGVFSLLNIIGNFRSPGFDANLWWVDLRFLPPMAANLLLVLVAIVLIGFAVRPPITRTWQTIIALVAAAIAFLAAMNAVQFCRELMASHVKSSFPVPLSLFVCAAFVSIMMASLRTQSTVLYANPAWGIGLIFVGVILVFPVLQVFCFGKTDYRRHADAIVVLGARAYADGKPSDALADRVRTACDLYKEGLASKLIFSGGPGDGEIHETEAMRRMAVKLGVKDEDILKDERGLNTQATVKNTEPMFEQLHAKHIMVVSHFYHLPRIKMAYQRDGWEVFTVPAKEMYFLRETPYMICREVAGLWVYYLRPLREAPPKATAVQSPHSANQRKAS